MRIADDDRFAASDARPASRCCRGGASGGLRRCLPIRSMIHSVTCVVVTPGPRPVPRPRRCPLVVSETRSAGASNGCLTATSWGFRRGTERERRRRAPPAAAPLLPLARDRTGRGHLLDSAGLAGRLRLGASMRSRSGRPVGAIAASVIGASLAAGSIAIAAATSTSCVRVARLWVGAGATDGLRLVYRDQVGLLIPDIDDPSDDPTHGVITSCVRARSGLISLRQCRPPTCPTAPMPSTPRWTCEANDSLRGQRLEVGIGPKPAAPGTGRPSWWSRQVPPSAVGRWSVPRRPVPRQPSVAPEHQLLDRYGVLTPDRPRRRCRAASAACTRC